MLTRKEARQAVRDELAAHNVSALVKDVKPISHNNYFRFSASCLQCTPQKSAVSYEATYYIRTLGASAGTLAMTSKGLHAHRDNASSDSGKIFLPQHEVLSKEYLKQEGRNNIKGLNTFLEARGVPADTLPTNAQLSQWLKNRTRGLHEPSAPLEPPRQMVVERSLQNWPTDMPDNHSDLFIVNDPPFKCDKNRVCIAFASRGMVQAMDRLSADSGAMCIDVKQSCLAHNWGIITAAFVVKDKLRNTNFTRVAGKRIQGTAYTSHAEPVLQAIVNVESTDNVIQFLNTLKRLWSKYCPTKKPLDTWVEQVHKDYHKALEAARRQCMPHARPVNDFFHLTEKESTMDSKLIHVSATPGKHHKEHKSWLMHSLRLQRHLPTLDLSSAIYKGFLQRLSSLGEEEVRDYLGPSGHPTYCIELGVQELHDSYGVAPLTQDQDEQIIFCYHWNGLCGTIPGTDCGDQPLEAFHSPWQTQLDTLGHQTQAPRALDTMQTVYRTWHSQLSWSSSTPLLMVPQGSTKSFGAVPCCPNWDAAQCLTLLKQPRQAPSIACMRLRTICTCSPCHSLCNTLLTATQPW